MWLDTFRTVLIYFSWFWIIFLLVFFVNFYSVLYIVHEDVLVNLRPWVMLFSSRRCPLAVGWQREGQPVGLVQLGSEMSGCGSQPSSFVVDLSAPAQGSGPLPVCLAVGCAQLWCPQPTRLRTSAPCLISLSTAYMMACIVCVSPSPRLLLSMDTQGKGHVRTQGDSGHLKVRERGLS